MKLEIGKTYEVVKAGATLWYRTVQRGNIGVTLIIGDKIKYKGAKMGFGSDNIEQDMFERLDKPKVIGQFSPALWGSTDTSFLKEVE